MFVICDCDAHRGPHKSQRFLRQEKAMLHCDLRVRWKVASDLRSRAAISEPETPFFLRDFWRFGSVNAEIASDCDCPIWCAKTLGELIKQTSPPLHQGKKTHKRKQICWIVPGLGGYQTFVIFQVISYVGEKAYKQKSPPQNPGTIPRNVCLCVISFVCFFSRILSH